MLWFENERDLFLIAVIFYGCSVLYSIFLWQKEFRIHNRINYLLLLSGYCFHVWAMVERGASLSRCPVNNLYEAVVFVDWTIVSAYLALGIWARLRFLGAFASPIIFGLGVFALMPGLDTPYVNEPAFINPWAYVHATLILLSYGAFGIGSIAALMYLTQEHDLKVHKLRAVFSLMPPIERLEMVVGRVLMTGFLLLTAGLTIGALYLKETSGAYLTADPKVLWSAFVWILYLVLLLMRWVYAQGGRRFAWGAVGSFAFVLLTFWGFNLLSGIHQP